MCRSGGCPTGLRWPTSPPSHSLSGAPTPSDSGFHVEDGLALAAEVFESVIRHDVEAELVVTAVEPVVAYVASMNAVQSGMVGAPAMEAGVRDRVGAAIEHRGAFRVRTHSGCLVCR